MGERKWFACAKCGKRTDVPIQRGVTMLAFCVACRYERFEIIGCGGYADPPCDVVQLRREHDRG